VIDLEMLVIADVLLFVYLSLESTTRVKEGSVPWTGGSIGTEKSSILHALDCMSNLQHPTKPTCAMAVGSWQLRPTGDFPPPTHY